MAYPLISYLVMLNNKAVECKCSTWTEHKDNECKGDYKTKLQRQQIAFYNMKTGINQNREFRGD